MRESDLEALVLRSVEEEGGQCIKLKIDSKRGFPDRLIVLHDMILFVEFKLPKGKVSPQQEYWIKELRRLDKHAFVCSSHNYFMGYVEGVRDRPPS